MILLPVERTIVAVTLAISGVCLILIWQKGIIVEPQVWWFSFAISSVFIAIGQFYRRFRKNERIALATHVVALFVIYSVPASLFNVLLLPRPSAPIDAWLVQIDAWFGYSWPAACAWIAQYAVLSDMLRELYTLTLAQLLFAFLFLGMANDPRRLHAAALGCVLASLITIFSWAFFPSSGASAYWTLAPDIANVVRPIVDSEYGAELNRLLVEGVADLTTLETAGLIGFPSFHTVMALMSLIAIWPYRYLRYPLLVATIALVPAILIHGGHNLMDVIGGIAVTLLSWKLAILVYDAKDRGHWRKSVAMPALANS